MNWISTNDGFVNAASVQRTTITDEACDENGRSLGKVERVRDTVGEVVPNTTGKYLVLFWFDEDARTMIPEKHTIVAWRIYNSIAEPVVQGVDLEEEPYWCVADPVSEEFDFSFETRRKTLEEATKYATRRYLARRELENSKTQVA